MEYFSKDDVLNLLSRNSITKKITLADGVSIYDSVKNLPTADVVPKSEVDTLREIRDLCNATILEQGVQIYKLKISDASKEECTIRQHNEIKELRAELNKVKQEVAREIIKDLVKFADDKERHFHGHGVWYIDADDVTDFLAELKKKYTKEGE